MSSYDVLAGLSDTAAALQREAGLPRTNSPPPLHPASPHIYSSPSTPKMVNLGLKYIDLKT